jgi:flagellar hook assembly protein FlgD
VPAHYKLSQNSPNPFNGRTTITYALPRRSYVTLDVVSMQGQRIRQLVSEMQEPGEYTVSWESEDDSGRCVEDGQYLCRMTARAAGGGAFMQSCLMELVDE